MERHRLTPLADRHSHVSLYAALQGCSSLADAPSRESVLACLRALPRDRMNLVLGWHSGRFPLEDGDLETLPPLLLVNLSLHGVRLSPAGAEHLRDAFPELVARHRDPIWSERNMPMLFAAYAHLAGLTRDKLEAFLAGLADAGIGAVEDLLLTDAAAWELMETCTWAGRIRAWTVPAIFHTLPEAVQKAVVGLKFFTDGALGTRTAALSQPYRDGTDGMLLQDHAALEASLAAVVPLGKAVAIHAIGDRAIDQSLDVLEALDRAGLWFPEVRLEHVQFITQAQARRARDLGCILSMQPNFTSDSVDYADRLEASWLEANNPFRMLLDTLGFVPGKTLIFGSDGMPHGLAYAAQWSLFPPYAGQRLTVAELVAGYGATDGDAWELAVDEASRTVSFCKLSLGVQGKSR